MLALLPSVILVEKVGFLLAHLPCTYTVEGKSAEYYEVSGYLHRMLHCLEDVIESDDLDIPSHNICVRR